MGILMKKILVIEDDKFLGDILIKNLILNGYETKLVVDGNVAIKYINAFKPDIIILDLLVPNLNGYEILEKLQVHKNLKNIPVIILSNSGQPLEISRALSLGVKDYLVKAHFDPSEVLEKIKKQINLKGTNINEDIKDIFKDKTIMWIEDDQFLNDIINKKMSTLECNFIHLYSGDQILEKLNNNKIDILILDILLPGLNGIEILKIIKNEYKKEKFPIIVMSNMNQVYDMKIYKDLGVDDFIIKSQFSLDDILKRISNFI